MPVKLDCPSLSFLLQFQSLSPVCPLEGTVSLLSSEKKNWKLCNSVCLVCCCISTIKPQSHSASQTSSAKVSERSRASAISDDSCFCGARSRFSHDSSSSCGIILKHQSRPHLLDWFRCWWNCRHDTHIQMSICWIKGTVLNPLSHSSPCFSHSLPMLQRKGPETRRKHHRPTSWQTA